MAAGSGRRHRSHRMRAGGKIVAADGVDLKPSGRVRGLVKSDGRDGKSAGLQIERRIDSADAGHVVKPGGEDSAEEAWIYVRGCRIKRADLRFNSHGDVYVPDSEDDESSVEVAADGAVGMELPPVVAVDGAVGVHVAPAEAADGAAGVELGPAAAAAEAAGVELAPVVAADGGVGLDAAPIVATDGAAGVDMNPEVAARLAKKVLGEDLHPEVAALLAKVLSKMEPFYHECFIDMYKVMMPLFFTPAT